VNTQALISIIIPVYKVEAYIEKCAASLFRQSYQYIEYIFVNDCTPDNSILIIQKMLEQYPNRKGQVAIINHEYNRGSAAARQSGINSATGEYIIMADGDDWVEPDMINRMYYQAKKENADIVIADYYVNYQKKEKKIPQPAPANGKDCIYALLTANLHGASWNKLVKRSLYMDNAIVYFEGLNMWEDLVTSVQLCFFAKKIVYLPSAFYHYMQINPNAYTHVVSEKSLQNMIDAITFFERFFKEHHVYEVFEHSLCYEKLTVKLNLLIHSSRKLQKERNSMYLETNKIIMKHPNISLCWRIALVFASLGILPVFMMLRWFGKKLTYFFNNKI
jgi:glycosyltransferase involved in cell wall biosynthesis